MQQESWRLELDEFIQTTNLDVQIEYSIHRDLDEGHYMISLLGYTERKGLIYSELVQIPPVLAHILLPQIELEDRFRRDTVPLGLVDLLASKSEEYRVYMCRSLGVQ